MAALKHPIHDCVAQRDSVLENLRRRILDGTYQVGDRLPTFAQLQADLGAASNTVDRAFATLEREGLVVRRKRSGVYVAAPQKIATGNIGVLGFHFNAYHLHPYWLHLMRGMQEAAQDASREILFLNPGQEVIRWEKVDGVLIVDGRAQLIRSLPPHMPCVTLLHRVPDVLSIVADEYQGFYDATRHLLDLGHRRITILTDSELRLAGYRAALQDAGITPNAKWTRPVFIPKRGESDYREAGYATMACWLKEPGHPWTASGTGCTAVLAHNDDIAIGAIEALREAGRRVPQNVSVVGFDGTEIIKYFSPQLSTVQIPLEEMGRLGVETLRDWIDGEAPPPRTIVLPASFKPGDSSAPLVAKTT